MIMNTEFSRSTVNDNGNGAVLLIDISESLCMYVSYYRLPQLFTPPPPLPPSWYDLPVGIEIESLTLCLEVRSK